MFKWSKRAAILWPWAGWEAILIYFWYQIGFAPGVTFKNTLPEAQLFKSPSSLATLCYPDPPLACFLWALSLGLQASWVPNPPKSQIWEWFRLQLFPPPPCFAPASSLPRSSETPSTRPGPPYLLPLNFTLFCAAGVCFCLSSFCNGKGLGPFHALFSFFLSALDCSWGWQAVSRACIPQEGMGGV